MENIIEPTNNFDFTKFNLENPSPLQGGTFFTKLNCGDKKLPIYVQLPKCISKHGIIKNPSSKKSYIDLLFQYFETDLLTWFENLEITCRELIYQKRDLWFQTEMDLDDIENMFISPAKSYKSGKFLSIRAQIPTTKQIKRDYCIIYDESEQVLTASSITADTQLIPLIKIDGIKFTSKSFQLEITIPQIMVLNIEQNIKNGCIINRNKLENNKLENNKLENNKLENNKLSESLANLEINKSDTLEKLGGSITLEKTVKDEVKDNVKDKVKDKVKDEVKDEVKDKVKDEVKDKVNDEAAFNCNELQEIKLTIKDIDDEISLKKPNEIYYEIYKVAREKAAHMRKVALEAHLEARNIKTKYMLDDLSNSEDDLSNSEDDLSNS